MTALNHIAVVGASAAGVSVVEALRKEGYAGRITLLGDETDLPYDRPPLSKQVLAGEWHPEKALLRERAHFDGLGIDLRLGARAASLDVEGRKISLETGEILGYDGLVIATGARARTLPAVPTSDRVLTLRTINDARAIASALADVRHLVIVGAGFLGLEIAAVARSAGKHVTVVDSMSLPMLRPFGTPLAEVVRDLHTSRGVDLRLSTAVESIDFDGEQLRSVTLSDGTVCPADLVVGAIGAEPNDGWLRNSALTIDNGVRCDSFCAAGPGVYAAGDIANWENPLFSARMRVENRLNATEQAHAVAENMLGRRRPYAAVPYYWTHQYDVNFQAFGIFPPDAEFVPVAGDLQEHRFFAYYVRDGRVVGAIGSRMAGRVRRSRDTIRHRLTVDEALASAA